MGGFWPGTRSTFRRVTGYRRTARWGTIKATYTIPEKKYIDQSNIAVAMDETPVVVLLNGLSLGTSATSRVGQNICMKSFHLKFTLRGPANTTTVGNVASVMTRVMVVLDLQPNGVLASGSDILEDTTPGIGIVSPIYMANAMRFKVLFDRRYEVQNNFTPTAGSQFNTINSLRYDEIFEKMNHYVQYADSNNGDITDIKTGALLLVFMSETAIVGSQPAITHYTRVRYTDS